MTAALGRLANDLLNDLLAASASFHADDEDAGRQGAIDAVCAVVRFIQAAQPAASLFDNGQAGRDWVEAATEPLFALASALNELERGVTAPILKPVKAGNMGLPEYTKLGRAHAAAAMDALIQAGMPLAEAAKFVEGRLPTKFGGLAEKSEGEVWGAAKADWKAVENWRDELARRLKEPSPHAIDAILYARLTGQVRNLLSAGQGSLEGVKTAIDHMLDSGAWVRNSRSRRAKLERR